MTLVILIFLGGGVLLIVSAIENVGIIATFQSLASGQLPTAGSTISNLPGSIGPGNPPTGGPSWSGGGVVT